MYGIHITLEESGKYVPCNAIAMTLKRVPESLVIVKACCFDVLGLLVL